MSGTNFTNSVLVQLTTGSPAGPVTLKDFLEQITDLINALDVPQNAQVKVIDGLNALLVYWTVQYATPLTEPATENSTGTDSQIVPQVTTEL